MLTLKEFLSKHISQEPHVLCNQTIKKGYLLRKKNKSMNNKEKEQRGNGEGKSNRRGRIAMRKREKGAWKCNEQQDKQKERA